MQPGALVHAKHVPCRESVATRHSQHIIKSGEINGSIRDKKRAEPATQLMSCDLNPRHLTSEPELLHQCPPGPGGGVPQCTHEASAGPKIWDKMRGKESPPFSFEKGFHCVALAVLELTM